MIRELIDHSHRLARLIYSAALAVPSLDIVRVPPFSWETQGKGIGADGVRNTAKNVHLNEPLSPELSLIFLIFLKGSDKSKFYKNTHLLSLVLILKY